MTRTEFETHIASLRAYANAQLAAMDHADWTALTPNERSTMAQLRDRFRQLIVSLSDDVIAAELEAMAHAGRDLTPAELASLVISQ